MHDVLYHGTNIEEYDHTGFPGVVPRTFLGAIAVAALSYPLVSVVAIFFPAEKIVSQYIVRIVLGLSVCLAFIAYRRAVTSKLGAAVGTALVLVTSCQFHFLYYSSRPLPNTFALILVLLALRFWLLGQHGRFVWASGVAVVVFRFEVALFLGIVLLMELAGGRLGVKKLLLHLIPAGAVWLGITVLVDSFFWRRWLWPEGEVLWFNTFQNKSSNWGTSPFWWYFISALPRALLGSLPLVFWGVYRDRRSWVFLTPAVGFVALYSFLPHKELRFIVYSIPLFNLVAALGYSNIWANRKKLIPLVPLGALGTLLVSFCMALGFLYVSMYNYPGGEAFRTLHSIVPLETKVMVHVGVEPAMTGVSRFGELSSDWVYSKEEGLEPGSEPMMRYQYLLVSAVDYAHYVESHDVVAKAKGFSKLVLSGNSFPVRQVLEDKVLVLQRRRRPEPS
ncbi:hypothetical protein EMCRGX_G002119 [Ephydatia muelleri]